MSAATRWIGRMLKRERNENETVRPSAMTSTTQPAARTTSPSAPAAFAPPTAIPIATSTPSGDGAATDGMVTGDLEDDCVETRSAELLAETRRARRRVRAYCDSSATLADAAAAVVARDPIG